MAIWISPVELVMHYSCCSGVTGSFPYMSGYWQGVYSRCGPIYLFWAWDNMFYSPQWESLYGFGLYSWLTFATSVNLVMLLALSMGLASGITLLFAAVSESLVYPF
jgi:hypothetical protein